MDVDTPMVAIAPLSAAAEDALITFRLNHPDLPARQLARRAHHASNNLIPNLLRQDAEKDAVKRSQLLEIEIVKFATSLKKAKMATRAQIKQQEVYERQSEELERLCTRERQALRDSRENLARAKRQKENHEECDELARQLVGRNHSRTELDQLIAAATAEIALQEERHLAYSQETSARQQAFAAVQSALAGVMAVPKVEPERSASDLAGLELEIAAAAKVVAGDDVETSKEGSGSQSTNPRAGGTVAQGSTHLDPKASTFVPTITVSSSAPAAASNSRPHSRAVTPNPSSSSNTTAANRKANIPGLPTRPQTSSPGGDMSRQRKSGSGSTPTQSTFPSITSSAPRGLPARPDTSSSGSTTRPPPSRTSSSSNVTHSSQRANLTITSSTPNATQAVPNSTRIAELSNAGGGDDSGSTASELEDGEVVGSKRGRDESGPSTGRETRSKRARTEERDHSGK